MTYLNLSDYQCFLNLYTTDQVTRGKNDDNIIMCIARTRLVRPCFRRTISPARRRSCWIFISFFHFRKKSFANSTRRRRPCEVVRRERNQYYGNYMYLSNYNRTRQVCRRDWVSINMTKYLCKYIYAWLANLSNVKCLFFLRNNRTRGFLFFPHSIYIPANTVYKSFKLKIVVDVKTCYSCLSIVVYHDKIRFHLLWTATGKN